MITGADEYVICCPVGLYVEYDGVELSAIAVIDGDGANHLLKFQPRLQIALGS